MDFNYRYMVTDGDLRTCDSCESEAPLDWFPEGVERTKKKICEVCATTLIGRHTEGASRDVGDYTRRENFKAMAQVANHLLDKLTPRLTGVKAAEEIPFEAE